MRQRKLEGISLFVPQNVPTASPLDLCSAGLYIENMLQFEEAQERLLAAAQKKIPIQSERLSLDRAVGRFLVAHVISPVQVPRADYSAMDGYAVQASDFDADSSTRLPVGGECRTGHPSAAFRSGSCLRIFTGAQIPEGADTVVMQEDVQREGDVAVFRSAPEKGAHIRRAGEDLKEGACVLESGVRLNAFHLGLLASVEQVEVQVAVQPRVGIFCTGDELRAPGSFQGLGQLAESNSVAIAALARSAGAECQVAPVVKDDQPSMEKTLRDAANKYDLIVTIGGVSVGDHDVVRPALEAIGATILFHKVGIKPGKPVLYARLGETLVLGLPGNPSSAQVVFSLFGMPLLRAMQGDPAPFAMERRARLKSNFSQKKGRRGFYRGRLEHDEVSILSNQASGASTTIAWSNCLVVVDERTETLSAGCLVVVIAFQDL